MWHISIGHVSMDVSRREVGEFGFLSVHIHQSKAFPQTCNKKLLVTKGIATRSRKLLVALGHTTSNKKLIVRSEMSKAFPQTPQRKGGLVGPRT